VIQLLETWLGLVHEAMKSILVLHCLWNDLERVLAARPLAFRDTVPVMMSGLSQDRGRDILWQGRIWEVLYTWLTTRCQHS
jgi:hypothetical protein